MLYLLNIPDRASLHPPRLFGLPGITPYRDQKAEYHAAREQQGFCEGRIKDIEAKLSNAQVIDVTKMPNNGRVIFGATVTVLNLDSDEEQTYRIVGDDEADFKQNLISVNSPIARGLIGKEEDDVVVIKTPGGEVEFEVIKVEYL